VQRPNEETILGRGATLSGTHRSHSRGFSMVELAVSLCVVLILSAIAVPSLLQSFRSYQLNDSAARLSDILKFTRFEAVRRNTQISFQFQQFGNDWNVWADTIVNATPDPIEKQFLITGWVSLLPAGGPPAPAAITAALGGAPVTLSGNPGSFAFDARGAVRTAINGGIAPVYIFYLGGPTNPEFGYRAVVLLPSGSTQVWSAPAAGPWHRVS
jgi:prepilin-type N-terminal cleavage/methylation domain-containing protein